MKRMIALCFCLLVLACAHTRSLSDVHIGMNKAEVTQAWGGTYLVTHRIYEGMEVDVWDYNFWNGSGVRVYFHNDRVVATFYRPPGTYWRS